VYFKEKPDVLTIPEIYGLIDSFGKAALLAQQAGFDGVQLHAAHGYLIHQFLHPAVNNRTDEFKPDQATQVGTLFLQKIIENIRTKCGIDFPILVKISASDDFKNRFTTTQFLHLIDFLDLMKVVAIEISYGTMDAAFNIFRGDFPAECILAENHVYKQKSSLNKWVARNLIFPFIKKKFIEFQPMYNLPFAVEARAATRIPIIVVGGFKGGEEIRHAIHDCRVDFVSMCRPFIAEPNLVTRLKENPKYKSICKSCNQCAVMCDSQHTTRCYTHAKHDARHDSSNYFEQNLITPQ
jgi:2,4-dienoyl-CoA reductase-like NADH-dependent reductase (Old Yellow Enzyme family)